MDAALMGNMIFALDIGTRSVIGVVCKNEGNRLKVIAESILEHDCRSMIDGQVHDVDKVAEVVAKVKSELEEKIGFSLKEVAIAAAGRTLKTKCVHIEQDLGDEIDIDSVVVNGLEMSGINEASRQIMDELRGGKDHFYCVGYSIVSYYLNGYSITSLLSHRGRYVGADVLATFLPQSVVNGLYRVLDKCGLTAVSLTLEPIAAIEAVVPESIRLLNIALIDIGAGTSDIAITKRGAIVAYGMVPVAGDEVTESIANEYLVDFNTAEQIKRSTGKKKKLTFKDIMGEKRSVTGQEVLDIVKGSSSKIADEVSQAIIKYNGDLPKAVFCVGGGSQTPYLIEEIAHKLNIDAKRIALKKRNDILNIDTAEHLAEGPEGVTVIGIAIIAMKKVGHDFISVYVNGKECRLFNPSNLKVSDVLSLTGYDPSALIGKSGRGVKFTFNGEAKKVAGSVPTPPEIRVNDISASLDTEIKAGDYINIKEAINGKDAAPKVFDYIKNYHEVSYKLNGELITIEPLCTINGSIAGYDNVIGNGDTVKVHMPLTILEQAQSNGLSIEGMNIYANGKPALSEYIVQNGDDVLIAETTLDYNIKSIIKEEKLLSTQEEALKTVQEESIMKIEESIEEGALEIEDAIRLESSNKRDTEKLAAVDIIDNRDFNSTIVSVNGKKITLKSARPIFIDVFNAIDFDLSKPKGSIKLKLNGKDAGYYDNLCDGDVVEVYWEK